MAIRLATINDYITYEPRIFQQWEDKNVTYFTMPSPVVDHNWHELFKCKQNTHCSYIRSVCVDLQRLLVQNIAIPSKLMDKMGRLEDGIKLPDGNYYGSLMVFHNLHCLVRDLFILTWLE